MPVSLQYALMIAVFPIGWWLLVGGRPEAGERRSLKVTIRPMFRVLAALALFISTAFGWLSALHENSEPTTWRDDSLDDWRAERDAEHEAERQERARENRDR